MQFLGTLAQLGVSLAKRACHAIERFGQLADLVVLAEMNTTLQIAGSDRLSCLCQQMNGTRYPAGSKHSNDCGRQRHVERSEHCPPRLSIDWGKRRGFRRKNTVDPVLIRERRHRHVNNAAAGVQSNVRTSQQKVAQETRCIGQFLP